MKHFLSFVLLLFLFIAAQAQERTITGVVTASEDKQPIPGVAVTVKGTTVGIMTGIDGTYSIKVANEKAILQFSYIGYQKQEIVVGNITTIPVELIADFTKLDEVVVVGYGVQKKSLVTGAIAKINSEEIAKSNSLRASQALQGKTAGVVVMNNSGQPGDAVSVTIRGIGTNGNSNPLYIVDGLALDGGGLDFLNPSDIESIEVLKDAASAAIYGTRASNGVVLISTKQGKTGDKSSVSYEGYYGIQNPARKLDVTNSRDFMMLMNEAAANDNAVTAPFSPIQMDTLSRTNTDWQKEMFNANAVKQSHIITFQGGTDKSTYFSTFSYFKQDGIVAKGKSNFERFSYRLNTSKDFGIIKIGTNFALAAITSKGVTTNDFYNGTALVQALNMPEYIPVKMPDGSWGTPALFNHPIQEISNPIALTSSLNSITKTYKGVGSAYAELDFGKITPALKGIMFKSQYGAEYTTVYNRTYTPIYKLDAHYLNELNNVTEAIDIYQKYTITNTLNLDKTIGDHHINVVLGQEAYKDTRDNLNGSKNTVNFDDLDHAYLDNATNVASAVAGGYLKEHTLSSLFARANYDLKGKYMLTGIIRYDGSSRFGSQYKYGTFSSVSAGWSVSKEDFFKSLESTINNFKLRASWGQNGQEPDDNFQYAGIISTNYNYYFGATKTQTIGSTLDYYPNPYLQWSTSQQTDLGAELAFFQNRITLNLDYYVKTNKGLPLKVPPLALAGDPGPLSNGSDVQNKGFEFELGFKQNVGELKIELTATGNINKNKVVDIANPEKIIKAGVGGIGQADIIQSHVGGSLVDYYGYKTDGLFQNQAQIDAYVDKNGKKIQPGAKPGDVKFIDSDGDGSLSDGDRVALGSPIPKFTGGLNLNLTWKIIDFQMFWYTSLGAKNWEASYRYDIGYANLRTAALGRWTGENTSNDYPRMSLSDPNNNWKTPSDRNVKNANYTRLKTLTVGITLPKSITDLVKIHKARLFITGENLITITPYDGYEPEIGGDYAAKGIDHGNYPQARTVLGGLNITF